jgi:hypothetical protein
LELAFIPLVLWWTPYEHLPSPGWAVAFIAVAAAAMSVHDEMLGWQKGIWLLIIGAFLITELRAISKDHIQSEARALADRKTQDAAFKGVRNTQDADFRATAQSLESAIQGIQSTLITANATLLQTRPHSAIRFDKMEFAGTAPPEIKANIPYTFNFFYVNAGAETAAKVKILSKMYVGKFNDRDTQKELVKKFETEWKKGTSIVETHTVLIPNDLSFSSLHRTLTDNEMAEINNDGTMYYLIRFEYTDSTGDWRTDACGSFQREAAQIDHNIFLPCSVFVRFRYPIKQP